MKCFIHPSWNPGTDPVAKFQGCFRLAGLGYELPRAVTPPKETHTVEDLGRHLQYTHTLLHSN